jgi:hypothetical protein
VCIEQARKNVLSKIENERVPKQKRDRRIFFLHQTFGSSLLVDAEKIFTEMLEAKKESES